MTKVFSLFQPKQAPSAGGIVTITLDKRPIWVATVVQLPVYGELIKFTKLTYDNPGSKWYGLEKSCRNLPAGRPVILNEMGIEAKYIDLVLRDAFAKQRIMLEFNEGELLTAATVSVWTISELATDVEAFFYADHLMTEEIRHQLKGPFSEAFMMK